MSNKKYKCIQEYPFGPPIGTISSSNDSLEDLKIVASYPEFWEEIKEPLFITEDGVEIFEGDSYWHPINNYELQMETATEIGRNIYDKVKLKRFSTEQAAKDWVEINKPKLAFTTEDGINIYSNRKLYGVSLSNNVGYKAYDLTTEHEYKYNSSINLTGFKWFVDKDKAIAYVNLNKPRYSINDIKKAFTTFGFVDTDKLIGFNKNTK